MTEPEGKGGGWILVRGTDVATLYRNLVNSRSTASPWRQIW
jgi:hypothetical protein